MPKTMRWLVSLSAVCVFATLTAVAQQDQNEDPELREMEQYTLSMDNLTRWMDVMVTLQPVAKSHPEALNALEIDADKEESLDQLAKKISAEPALVDAMAKHGFTPRQFVLEEMVLFQASMAAAMMPAGANEAELAHKAHVNPANVAFVRQHKDEIEAMQKKYAPQGGDGSNQ